MILDYGIFFSRKVSVCLYEGHMLVGNRTAFTAIKMEFIDKHHAFLHPNAKRKRSYVEKIASDPRLLLRSKRNPKENLKLYVSLVTKGRYRPVIRGNKKQRLIEDAIRGKEVAWRSIATKDIYGYDKLMNVLNSDPNPSSEMTLKRKIMSMFKISTDEKDGMDEGKIICDVLKNEKEMPKEIGFSLRVHYDFCIKNKTVSLLDEIDREYDKMLGPVLWNKIDNEVKRCEIDHPFYSEVGLFNLFVKCKDNIPDFDRKVLEKDVFHTINERGIRDFIAERVERFYAAGVYLSNND
ncbi:hypothetical protein EROM_021220 [Encephalitozoon romaleae SJ-2008]|uniref:Uncharacterized protein n=1 Tax=Encephalitozoon romaleae (strain SJ-2008) TaxID=1178016 RepID=I7AQK1_ENCRO|nr:hypothetical protein EROM_021220 [Encephalitozoon romaleae SJ-2008]AFN82597.1 hypothetical protein EROM_021220 [Encephalitozoon romaleae SJ-2008]